MTLVSALYARQADRKRYVRHWGRPGRSGAYTPVLCGQRRAKKRTLDRARVTCTECLEWLRDCDELPGGKDLRDALTGAAV